MLKFKGSVGKNMGLEDVVNDVFLRFRKRRRTTSPEGTL